MEKYEWHEGKFGFNADGLAREQRIKLAASIACLDDGFVDALERNSHPSEKTKRTVHMINCGIANESLNCKQIKVAIDKELVNNKKAKRIAREYRKRLQEWVTGNSQFFIPPVYELQQLPPLKKETLGTYLDYYNSEAKKYWPGDEDETMEALASMGSKKMKQGQEIVAGNLEALFKDYIETSEENALEFLLYVFNIDFNGNVGLMLMYRRLQTTCIRRLSANPHFVRSFFNLLDENLYKKQAIKRIDPQMLTQALAHLYQTKLCEIIEQQPYEDLSASRTQIYQEFSVEPNKKHQYIIPAENVPHSWNGHRLVDPNINKSFQKLANELESAESPKEDDISLYRSALLHHRKYSHDFVRVNATDIPGMEDEDVRFHFFQNDSMHEGEIGVEVIVNGEGVVYRLDAECDLKIRSKGNRYPAVASEEIDKLYSSEEIGKWTSVNGIYNLYSHILRYAYHIFAKSNKEIDGFTDKFNKDKNDFGINLSEYTSEIEISELPLSDTKEAAEERQREITIYHGIAGHVRKLPEGWKPSREAIEAAKKAGIHLSPRQTFVKPHSRGNMLSEETKATRKI